MMETRVIARAVIIGFAMYATSGEALSSFNETRAVSHARLAGASHCSQDSLESWSCGWKCSEDVTSVKVCQGSTIKSYVGHWEGSCILSFEGTHDLFSFIKDLQFLRTSVPWDACDGCHVHQGFLNTYVDLKPCIVEALLANECPSIRIAGWSLGAAVGSLAMVDLIKNGWKIEESYDFGRPRVGDQNWSDHFEKVVGQVSWRLTHRKDPVPHLPPRSVATFDTGFRQAGAEAFYVGDRSDGYVLCSQSSDLEHCSQQYDNIFLNVLDHFTYVDVAMGKRGCGKPSSIIV
eukprot:TRINITY_DN3667_c0_g1_i1.p1 TRINITY_DN3667_c0_g1~~TRINITY_DN3667_c0_g1_i1.p1  ORF type:complete len:290 (-),score=41.43 TRINITY_DN3667_c0_g1_i1:67-936(-)